MNKTAIKNFAIWARVQLIEAAKQRAYEYEITEKGENKSNLDTVAGRLLTSDEKQQRQQLIEQIRRKGYAQVMEEAAYTWFNRFIALRFMEVNGFLPSKVRVFTDETGAFKPEIMKEAMTVEIDGLDRAKVLDLLDKQNNEELYKYLLITQCNALNQGLPYMFEKISNWTELLFPANLLRPDSIVGQMVSEIPEEDWQDAVQIIGWLYQYYITDLFNNIYDGNMSRNTVTKDMLPAATQLFTPDWVVRYMVENSLGRLWYEGHPSFDKSQWKYYLDEAPQEPEVELQLKKIRADYASINPEDIKVIDPCMGSGHILVYAFDVLLQIYTSCGWSERDAAKSIIENNLYGLDIDDRAGQLAYFAVMMKARKYNRRILNGNVKPNVLAIQDSGFMTDDFITYVAEKDTRMKADLTLLRSSLKDAKECGSILHMPKLNFAALYERIDIISRSFAEDMFQISYQNTTIEHLLPLVKQAEIMAQKYDVVITNPPYLGSSRFSQSLSKYINDNYSDEKSDLAMVMLSKMYFGYARSHAFISAITTVSWMYLKSFEKFRSKIIRSKDIVNLVDFGTELFDGKIGHLAMVSWVTRNTYISPDMLAIRLTDFCYSRRDEKQTEFFNLSNRHVVNQKRFEEIEGIPFAYSATKRMTDAFLVSKPLSEVANPKQGLITGDVNRFVRKWFEPAAPKINYFGEAQDFGRHGKWFPYSNGGPFRKWYGNNEDLVNWENDGFDVINFVDGNGKQRSRPQNRQFYFCEGGTWSAIAAGAFAVRYFPKGFLFSNAGMAIYANEDRLHYIIGFLNSKLAKRYLGIFNEGLNCNQGDVAKLPIIFSKPNEGKVRTIEQNCINLSKSEWDDFETSWNFKKHPLV